MLMHKICSICSIYFTQNKQDIICWREITYRNNNFSETMLKGINLTAVLKIIDTFPLKSAW